MIQLIIIFVLATSLLAQTPDLSKSCEEYLNYLNNTTPQTQVQQLTATNLFSGKGLNDLGDMWGCNNQQDKLFSTLLLLSEGGAGFFGFCFSQNCTAQDLSLYGPYIVKSINASLAENGIIIQNSIQQLQFVAMNPQTFAPKRDWLYYFVVFLSVSLVLISFVYPYMQFAGNKSFQNKWLQCFSLTDNWKKMLTLKNDDKAIAVMNCIRVMSFLQVVYGHEYFNHITLAANVSNLPTSVLQSYYALFVFSCLYSVDNFFYISGFFLGFVIVDKSQLKHLKFRQPMGYIGALAHRLFRLWPCFIFSVLIFWKLCNNIYTAPAWIGFTSSTETCDTTWWRQLLFIGIYGEGNMGCFGWGWYMECEWWIFMFTMALMVVMSENRLIGKLMIVATFLACQIYLYFLFFQKNFGISISFNAMQGDFFADFYDKPWTRCPPYFVGLFIGIHFKEWRNKRKEIETNAEKGDIQENSNRPTISYRIYNSMAQFSLGSGKWFIYAISIALLGFMIWGPRPVELNPDAWSNGVQNVWGASSRVIWVLLVFFITLPGLSGSRDIIARVMSSDFFAWMARITFTGYLVHYMILEGSTFGQQDSTYIGLEEMNEYFACELIITIVAAILLALFVELPFMNLENLVFQREQQEGEKPLLKGEESHGQHGDDNDQVVGQHSMRNSKNKHSFKKDMENKSTVAQDLQEKSNNNNN